MEGDVSMWLIILDKAIIPLLILILTPVLSALANRAIAAISEKTKVDMSQHQKDALDQMVHEAIDFAEEQAHKAVSKKTGALDGSSKMEKAVEYIQMKGKVLELDRLSETKAEELASLIEAKLFSKRLDAASPMVKSPAQLEASSEDVPEEADD